MKTAIKLLLPLAPFPPASLPPGYVWLKGADGAYLKGADGAYLYGVAP